MSQITREVKLDSSVIPPLDPSVLSLSDSEKTFLHEAITPDDEQLRAKLLELQKLAYAQHPYPCIHAFHFVNLMMSLNPVYPDVLTKGKDGKTLLLDLGCCMGSDVRKVVKDGYPAANVLGCDLRQEFIEYGYELYGDRDKCNIRFFADDIFELPYPAVASTVAAPESLALKALVGQLTHIYTGALFHLFDESTQYAIALRLTTLLKRASGAVIFGRHQGLEEEGLIDDHLKRIRYGHSTESWTALWRRVFSEVESPTFAEEHVRVDAALTDGFRGPVLGAARRAHMLVWSVRIV